MTMTNRTFGVEIECIGVSQTTALDALRAAGVNAEIESYNHNTRTHWKITYDSSVSGPGGMPGIEVVSPVLSGPEGLAELRKVADALNAAGATANRTCGLHVHVGTTDLTIDDIKTIVKRYTTFENVIDTFMPNSRRGDNNTYTKSMRRWAACEGSRLEACESLSALRSSYFDRYYKINLAAFVRQGTIEFRQHSGTVSAEKITNWVLFVLNFVEQSRVTMVVSDAAPARRRGRPGGRSNARDKGLFKILNMLNDYNAHGERPTIQRLAEVSGYSEASIPACISEIRRKWNVRVRKSRWANAYVTVGLTAERYEQIRSQVSGEVVAPAPVTRVAVPVYAGEDSALRGLPMSVVSYFNERAAELAA
jgi:hypothetical protein